MAQFLIDANLPYYFGLWNNPDYIHVLDIDDTWSDDIKNLMDENSLINIYFDKIEIVK